MASHNHHQNHNNPLFQSHQQHHQQQQSVNQAHNNLQVSVFSGPNLNYGPPPAVPPQHAQLAAQHHPIVPPAANAPALLPSAMALPPPPQPARHTLDPNGIYDGLTYRFTLLGHKIPGAPPPEREWSVQSDKCMENLRTLLAAKLEKAPAIIQQAAKTTRNSVKAQSKPKPIETATAVATFADPATSSKGAHRRVPDSSTSKANLAALDDLSRPFHELASAGAEFTRTMRIYQYKHDGCGFVLNELGHDIRVPEELSQAWRTMRTSLNRLRWILRAISHIDKPANKNNDAMQRLRPFAEEEAVGHIKLAVEYVEFYMRPYEGALGCLLSTMRAWEDGGVNGEAKWARLRDAMMRTDDGDATRLRKQKG